MAQKTAFERIFTGDVGHHKNAHVIVCGNEKGGSGKTTITMHIAIALLQAGFRVATIDLDQRQQSLTRYIQNRRDWARKTGESLELPNHFRFDAAVSDSVSEAQLDDYNAFINTVTAVEGRHDFVVIDTPGADGYLMRLAHSMADTLVTPLNDSFVDLDLLARVDGETLQVSKISQYAEMVRHARRQRRKSDNGLIDWIVLRNRMSSLMSHNNQNVMACLQDLSMQLGFRIANGLGERMIYRAYFPCGLTALDDPVASDGPKAPSASQFAARQEIASLIRILRLPVDEQNRQRSSARNQWLDQSPDSVTDVDASADGWGKD